MVVRVRFAPSPTGWLHIGGARTALYNFLFARKNKGKFILRIEDTDRSRSTEEAIEKIIEDLGWLGLEWDEGPEKGGPFGPYRQTERDSIYREHLDRLLESGNAYPCFCLPEEIERQREEALKRKASFRYNRRCRNLSSEEQQKMMKMNPTPAIRYKTPLSGGIVVEDKVKGEISFDLSQLDDFVIARADGTPTYNFAVVVDDSTMKISHVIRGDDHLSNTPKQILIYETLGFEIPEFAHLSMILGSDKKRLSKRHGATAVFEFRRLGYIPEAMLNYLTLLGWSFDDKTTIFSKDELIEKFSLERVSSNPAVFDPEKLNWLNGYWIRQLTDEELAKRLLPFVKERYGAVRVVKEDFMKLVRLTKERMKHLCEFIDWCYFYFVTEEEFTIDEKDLSKLIANDREEIIKILEYVREALKEVDFWGKTEIETKFRELVEKTGLKAKKVFQPVRLAVTGRLVSLPLFESLEILKKDEALTRIEKALAMLRKN